MIDDGLTDEERRKWRDQLSDEERQKLLEESHRRMVAQGMSKASEDLIRWKNEQQSEKSENLKARLTQIEKRLETLEMKQ